MRPREFVGFGAFEALGLLLGELGARRVLLVTGRHSLQGQPEARKIAALLAGVAHRRYDRVQPNPSVEGVEQALEAWEAFRPDLVLAVGGGSVLDTAKLVTFFAAAGLSPRQWLQGERPGRVAPRPLVAVPTTAGPGSQVTPFAVMYAGRIKHSVEHPALLPLAAIVDPALTLGLPPYETAVSGADALAQALEAHWSVKSTPESLRHSRAALGWLVPNLVAATRNPTGQVRLNMAVGAHLAGKAIAIARTTAAHSVSYPITAHFGVPHGHAVALTLPDLFAFNAGVAAGGLQDPRGGDFVRERLGELALMLGDPDPARAPAILAGLFQSAGLDLDFGHAGITGEEDLQRILQEGFTPERVRNNPRRLERSDLEAILRKRMGLAGQP